MLAGRRSPVRLAVAVAALAAGLLVWRSALADVTVYPATGGEQMPIGPLVAVGGPVVIESASGDIGEGTIELRAPAGFEFDTTPDAVSARAFSSDNCSDLVVGPPPRGQGGRPLRLGTTQPVTTETVTATATTVTIHVRHSSLGDCRSGIQWSGIRVRALSAGSGDITNAGTGVIVGAPAGTSFGHLATSPAPTPTPTFAPPV